MTVQYSFFQYSFYLGFEDRLFGGSACVTGCNPLNGTAIAVPASAQIANIN